MNKIRCRGKRVGNGGWVYGWYIRASGHWHNKGIHEDWIICHAMQNGGWFALGAKYPVIPETVGRSTGLKDRNGVEIYEGDILRNVDNPFVDKLPFSVEWNEYYGAWFWLSLLGEFGTDHLYQNIAKDCEIIGNIHDWREE